MSLHSDQMPSMGGALPPRGKVELAEALDVLRREIDPSKTKAFAKAVASLLFFEYGEKPTSNRVRALIGHGSLGTVVEGIDLFWGELRRDAQGNAAFADLPALPALVSQQGGDLLLQLWRTAAAQATAEFEQRRAEHDRACTERIAQADAATEAARADMESARQKAGDLESRMASVVFERDLLTARVAADERSLGQLHTERDAAQQRLAAVELDAKTKLSNSDAERTRLLREVDQGREALKKLGLEHGRELVKRDTALSEEIARHGATQALCKDQQQALNSLTTTLAAHTEAAQAAQAAQNATASRKRVRGRGPAVKAVRAVEEPRKATRAATLNTSITPIKSSKARR